MSLERGVKVAGQKRHPQPVLVSEMIPLVSAVPNVTIPRYQGKLPPRGWGAKDHRKSILSGRLRPRDIHLGMSGKFWLGVMFAPAVLPALPAIAAANAVSKIAGRTQERAAEEMDRETALRERLLELEMRYELGDITEEEYRQAKEEITRELEALTGQRE